MKDDEPIAVPITRKKYPREGRPLLELKLTTRVPDKYRVVDLETGDIWEWAGPKNPTAWMRADDIKVEMKRKRRRK